MGQLAAILLYRTLLRELRRQLQHCDALGAAISLRADLVGAPGSYNASATPSGPGYQLEVLEELVPALAVPPTAEQLPLTYTGLKQLIHDNFKANKQQQGELQPGYTTLDQGFAALRALPRQCYLQSCSSSSTEQAVRVDATSCYAGRQANPWQDDTDAQQHFRYRLRITNQRSHPIKVMGRGWAICNHPKELVAFVRPSPDNAVVGQQPVIPSGGCFEYYSYATLQASRTGFMEGILIVDLYEEQQQDEQQQQQQDHPVAGQLEGNRPHGSLQGPVAAARVRIPVAPFQLQQSMASNAAKHTYPAADS